MSRRIVFAPGGFGCSECGWTMKRPKVGPFGRTSSKARAAQVRSAFVKHHCARHPR